jgi:hypothetical protein
MTTGTGLHKRHSLGSESSQRVLALFCGQLVCLNDDGSSGSSLYRTGLSDGEHTEVHELPKEPNKTKDYSYLVNNNQQTVLPYPAGSSFLRSARRTRQFRATARGERIERGKQALSGVSSVPQWILRSYIAHLPPAIRDRWRTAKQNSKIIIRGQFEVNLGDWWTR